LSSSFATTGNHLQNLDFYPTAKLLVIETAWANWHSFVIMQLRQPLWNQLPYGSSRGCCSFACDATLLATSLATSCSACRLQFLPWAYATRRWTEYCHRLLSYPWVRWGC